MPTRTLIRWSAPLLALGALGFAAFIIVANGEFTGAELGLSRRHHFAHVAHFFSSVLFLFGITGFYGYLREASGGLGLLAWVVAMAGDALWVGTGVITAWVWRTISASAPQLVSAEGAFFDPPLPIIFIATVGFSLGQLLLNVVAWRTHQLPRHAVMLSVLGLVLTNLTPPPWGLVPYWVLQVGALLFLAGAVEHARAIWRGAPNV